VKKLKLSVSDKQKLVEEFKNSLETYGEDTQELKIAFEKDMTETPKEKITIYFTPLAYLKSDALVKAFKGEVGWHGLMRQTGENSYLVYDIIVYPQNVSGARTLDPTANNEWYEKYGDVIEDMRFQAHSHVDMSTTPSPTDINNQREVVKNTITGGYMLFQIWNKKGDINSYFYDINDNLLYDRSDINIEITAGDENETLKMFIEEAKGYVEDMVPVLKQPQVTVVNPTKTVEAPGLNYRWINPPVWSPEKMNDPFYWQDGNGHEGWG